MDKSKIKKIIFVVLLVILLTAILCVLLYKQNKTSKINQEKLMLGNIDIAGVTVDISKVIQEKPNQPQLGAGMIPIKWDGTYWQITNTNDNNWYDYSNGKFATIMLSDGKYVSEERYKMTGHELSKSETQIQNIEDLGTIFVWIPRGLYINNEYKYLKDISILDIGAYKTPNCFTYTISEDTELALNGVWVAIEPKQDKTELQTEIRQMEIEDNKYGIIRNERVENISKDILKVTKSLQEGKEAHNQQISNLNAENRIVIKVLNTNMLTPIIGSTFYTSTNRNLGINILYNQNSIEKIIYINGKNVQNGGTSMTIQPQIDGTYKFAIIDTQGNIREYKRTIGPNDPDLTGFRVDNTYIVTYTANGDEISSLLIKDALTEDSQISDTNTLLSGGVDQSKVISALGQDWYDYSKQNWANIVVRNGINEAYFVWIPRYVYKLDNTTQTSDVKFVTVENKDNDGNRVDTEEWYLSEAFKWTDLDGNEVQLSGYWMSKYGLSDNVDLNLQAKVIVGRNKIKVSDITSSVSSGNFKYNVYVYKEGVNRVNADEADTISAYRVAYKENVTNSYLLQNIEIGKYEVRVEVKNAIGISVGEKWYTITVYDAGADIVQPDLTGFNPNYTYYVVYNDNGEEELTKITEEPPENWYDYDWQEWANIVVINPDIATEEKRAYFVWIPRYVYKLDNTTQTSEVKFVTKENLDSYGNEVDIENEWNLSEAFKWTDLNGNEVQLSGYWMSKYGLSD